jgi:hypothetical protein
MWIWIGRCCSFSAICLLACLCLALAWAHEADYFAMFFAAAAGISGEEAIRRSL